MDVNLSGNVVAAVATTTGSGTNTAGVGAGNSGAGTGDQSASGTVVASSAVTISAAGTDAANASVAATSTGTDPSAAGTPSGTTPAGTTVTGATSGTPSDTAATKLKHAVAHINSSLKTDGQSVEFSIDQSSKRTVVKVVDTTTNQVIQQMPTEEVLQMAKVLSEKSGSGSVSGSLINQQA